MKKIIILIISTLALITFNVNAQYFEHWRKYRLEIMLSTGTSHYFGNIGGSEKEDPFFLFNTDLKQSQPALHISGRYKIHESAAIKIDLGYSKIKGSDEGSYYEDRGKEFSAPIYEATAQIEMYFNKEKYLTIWEMKTKNALQRMNMANYFFVGFGGFYSKPDENDQQDTDQLSLEYSGAQANLNLPVGIGAKFVFSERLFAGMEIGYRKTFTDKLDNTVRQDSNRKDAYMLMLFNIGYRFKTNPYITAKPKHYY